MANTIWFVAHRYAAPSAKDLVKGVCLWNRDDYHHRKLIASSGATVIDSTNVVITNQNINFVGEWECCSHFATNGNCGLFRFTHTPIYSPYDARIPKCQNTDPYVFGKEFYWSCCKLSKSKRSRVIPGDIVIFGSYTKQNGKIDKMVIDTVLVVDHAVPKDNELSYPFSQCYRDVTLAHIGPFPGVFAGKMYDVTKDFVANAMFSFVPCKRTENELIKGKLEIDLEALCKSLGCKEFGIERNGGHLAIGNSQEAFNALVEAVRGAGYELGVYMPEPVLTVGNAVIDAEAKKLIPKTKNNAKNKCSAACSGGKPDVCGGC